MSVPTPRPLHRSHHAQMERYFRAIYTANLKAYALPVLVKWYDELFEYAGSAGNTRAAQTRLAAISAEITRRTQQQTT